MSCWPRPKKLSGKIALARVNPLFKPYLNAEILTRQLSTQANLTIVDGALTEMDTEGVLNEFKLRSFTSSEELVTWEKLIWHQTNVNLTQQKLIVPLVEVGAFDSQFIISKEGKTNLDSLFVETTEVNSAPPKSAENNAAPWQFELHKLVLNNASFRFQDESLTSNFMAAVEHFSGQLTDLSSKQDKVVQFDFKGDVDGYAPVAPKGNSQPFLTQSKLDARLNFENMDLGGFSTYSNTYAGWRIDKGLLTAHLHYRYDEGRILGDNHVVLDQLKLGERVRDARALDILLRLALSLLTNEKAIATLDVSGKPDDPNFDIGKVIWAAVRNTLMKIVTAPFNLLASLVNTKEDLGLVKFNSDSTQLLSGATRKLTLLEGALRKRPNLRADNMMQPAIKWVCRLHKLKRNCLIEV